MIAPSSLRRTVAGLALLAAASGCERPETGDRLVVGWARDIGTLLPVVESSALDAEIDEMLYLSLNSARWRDGHLEYVIDDLALASGWEFRADSTSLTYTIREDAVWSDGEPIDADDVIFTYQLIRLPETSSPYVDIWEDLDSVVAAGARRVTFHFNRRHPQMLFDTGVGIVPAHVFEGSALDHASLTGHPRVARPESLVVSGPYRVAEWRPGERLVLAPNPRAFTGRPETERVVFRVLPQPTTRRVELESGGLDAAHPVPYSIAEAIRTDARYRIETVDDRFYDYIAWNPEGFAPFGDPEVRRALSLAVNRAAILEALEISRYARPAAGPYPPIFRELQAPGIHPDPYLPDSARAILASRGWRDSDGDGTLDREGQPFRFTLVTQAGNERRTGAAEIIQADYAELGVRMQVRQLEFNALLTAVFQERAYQAVLLGWQVALEPDYLVGHFWPPDHPSNITGYASAEVDSLIRRARAAESREGAASFWSATAARIARDRPYAFLWYLDDPVALYHRVQETRIDTYGVYQNLHHWRLAE